MAGQIVNNNWRFIFLFLAVIIKFKKADWPCYCLILIQRLKNFMIFVVRLINFIQVKLKCCLLSCFSWLYSSSWYATWLYLINSLLVRFNLWRSSVVFKVTSSNLTFQMACQYFLGLIRRALVADLVKWSNRRVCQIRNFMLFILPKDGVKMSHRRAWYQIFYWKIFRIFCWFLSWTDICVFQKAVSKLICF